ncbi:hypothetical protein [Brevundimonas sp.]|uniref:hypothetical protein n=1 Tax=Brevundimonas sp. TaxID=1871086 RepID=UPI002D3E0D23|nr:hypothetical protein [Brevundimonas sp.]HYC68225.1 hypothetical protein [Brevundimonas sp.]
MRTMTGVLSVLFAGAALAGCHGTVDRTTDAAALSDQAPEPPDEATPPEPAAPEEAPESASPPIPPEDTPPDSGPPDTRPDPPGQPTPDETPPDSPPPPTFGR